MARGKGTNLIISIVKGATWGTAPTMNAANKGILVESYSWKDNIEELQNKGFNADSIQRELAMFGRAAVEGSFTFMLRHQGHGLIQALALGVAGTPTGGSPYVHTHYRLNNLFGIFFGLAWDDGIKTHTVDSCKVKKISYNISAGHIYRVTIDWVGRKRTTGATGGLASVTEVATIQYVQFNQSLVTAQMAAQGSALATQAMNKATIDFEWEMPIDDRFYSSAGAPYMDELIGGRLSTKGTIEVPYEVDTYNAGLVAGSLFKLLITNTYSANAVHVIGLPSLKVLSANTSPSDMSAIPHSFNFTSELAASTPSGMALAVPYIAETNLVSTDVFA